MAGIARPLWRCCHSQSIAGPSRLPLCPPQLPVSARPFSSTPFLASGHNRWSKIRHKKGAADAAKSKVFSRISGDIVVALRPPNSTDPSLNSKLAELMVKARDAGMTKASIQSLIDRARSVADGTGQNMTFEAMGSSGKDAFIIECVTDNIRRTTSNIKEITSKYGGRITPVGFMFERKGSIVVEPQPGEEDFERFFEIALDGGAEDVRQIEGDEGEEWEAIINLENLNNLHTQLSSPDYKAQFTIRTSEPAYLPSDPIQVSDDGMGITEEDAEMAMKLVDALEGDNDVVRVWSNISDS